MMEDFDAKWTQFAQRHGLTIHRHGHGLEQGAHGLIDGIQYSVQERVDGIEITAWNVVPQGIALALCDRAFLQWAREPLRLQMASRVKRELARTGPAPTPALQAYFVPTDASPSVPDTGVVAFDERFLLLSGDLGALHAAQLELTARLASPVKLALSEHLMIQLPQAELADELLEQARRLSDAVRRSITAEPT